MARERKISDEDLPRLRFLYDEEGWSLTALAAEFGVTRQHVGRLVRGEQRPMIGPLDAGAVRLSVAAAVEQYLADGEWDDAAGVLAATARVLATKLDACSAADSATAAQVMPRLASELVDVLARLRGEAPQMPDRLTELRQQRAARRMAMMAAASSQVGAS